MAKYKVVPVEPTPEMVDAAADAYMPFGDMDLALRMATLAAPAVQGEPVGWQFFQDGKWYMGGYTKNHRENTVAAGFPVRDLYAAYHPAEQQPISHDWDDQDKCRRCGDRDWYASATCSPKQQPDDRAVLMDKQCRESVAAALGFIRGGDYAWSYLLQQIKDITSAERKQPAPDVSGLVAIAREIVDLHAKRKVVLTVHIEALEDALATYHNQGADQ